MTTVLPVRQWRASLEGLHLIVSFECTQFNGGRIRYWRKVF